MTKKQFEELERMGKRDFTKLVNLVKCEYGKIPTTEWRMERLEDAFNSVAFKWGQHLASRSEQ